MRYNTGNPVEPNGSADPRDLFDNAENLDLAVNGDALTWVDRTGKTRKSFAGMDADFKSFLISSGYEFIGDYDLDGPLTITRPNQVFTKDGEYWRSGPSLDLPYTTVNNWTSDQPKFVSVGDAVLRQALAAPGGAHLVGYSGGQTVLDRLDEIASVVGGQAVGMSQTGVGAVYETALTDYRRRIYPEQFGAVGDGIADDTLALQRALDRGVGQVVTLRPGAIYGISAALQIDSGTTLVAYGAQIKRLAFIDNMIRNKSNGTVGGWSANTNITLLGGHWRSDDAFGQQLTVIGFSHCTNIKIQGVTVTHNGLWHHIELNGVRDGWVENCTFNGGYAQNAATNEAVQIDANIDGSQWPWFGPADSTACYNVHIVNNVFNGNGSCIGTHSGAATARHQNLYIEGNTFVKPLYVSIHAMGWSAVKISNNRFEGGYWGIYHEYNDAGITNDWLIEGNTFYAQGDSDWAPGGDGRAMVIDGNASYFLRNFRIVNNFVGGITLAGKSRHGITVNYAHQGVIAGNTVDGVNRTGIYVYGGDRINVNNNMLINCNLEAASGAVAGIVLGNTGAVDTNRLTVVGNTTETLYMTGTQRSVVRQNQITTASGLTQAGTNNIANVGNNLIDTTFT